MASDYTGFRAYDNYAMTKAEYDEYMNTHSRTPGDKNYTVGSRGQRRPQEERHDTQVRGAPNPTADRQRRYIERKKEQCQ